MPIDGAPEPFSGDYYVTEADTSIRGAVVHEGRTLNTLVADNQIAVKIPQSFTGGLEPPPLPQDPLYVFPNSRFLVSPQAGVGPLANLMVAGFQVLCPNGTEVVTDDSRMRIAVIIPGTLEFKVKFFKNSDDQILVTIRRDSGDWFAFIQIYSSIKKYLRQHGIDVEVIGF
jgi:hypothetical protein